MKKLILIVVATLITIHAFANVGESVIGKHNAATAATIESI